jgi:hypothetical protein
VFEAAGDAVTQDKDFMGLKKECQLINMLSTLISSHGSQHNFLNSVILQRSHYPRISLKKSRKRLATALMGCEVAMLQPKFC